ncbi:GNAT family N-acetyltransferase [Janibacter cremeus]|uniref:GNAT family N-acetyltransferase n=1 Tax=Janibacter cremeus TaxID=1285192 RepID=UPI0023F716BF|nr:GNAT family N-acetyltransferase [Janibacter cremeus]WEV78086.1 GNAT family N-acetyltransferase [Janibacter cremeus]
MSDLFRGLTSGSRAVVRTRIEPPPADGPQLTDTVGEIAALDEESVRMTTRTGEVTLRRDLVVATRAIPPRPTRRGAPHRAIGIEDLHLVMTKGQPGSTQAWLGEEREGWLLRAGHGWTGRSNSALPLGDPGLPLPDAVDAVDAWYTERDLTPLVMLPRPRGAGTGDDPLGRLLLQRGWTEGHPADVLTGRTDTLLTGSAPAPEGLTLHASEHVDETWLAGSPPRLQQHHDAAREILALPPHQVFLTAQDGEGGTAGVVRVALADGWAGIFGLHVAPGHRRRGVGRWLTLAAARAARESGASLTYLQVEPSNEAAQQLYRGLGMQQHHDYVYLARGASPLAKA